MGKGEMNSKRTSEKGATTLETDSPSLTSSKGKKKRLENGVIRNFSILVYLYFNAVLVRVTGCRKLIE